MVALLVPLTVASLPRMDVLAPHRLVSGACNRAGHPVVHDAPQVLVAEALVESILAHGGCILRSNVHVQELLEGPPLRLTHEIDCIWHD